MSEPTPTGRVLGDLRAPAEGPTLICVGALHGNEPAGVRAAERVLPLLESRLRRGRVLAFVGHSAALERGERQIDLDLNRAWTPDRFGELQGAQDAESVEQRALLGEFDRACAETPAGQGVFLLDLHTTSSPTAPFSVFGDTLRNRSLARSIGAPMILGLEEQIDGCLTEHATSRGAVAVAFEAGPHDEPSAIDRHADAILLTAAHAGLIDRDGEVRAARRRMIGAARGVPPLLDVVYRHALAPGHSFRMEPGFATFDWVRAGQHIAHDEHGPVASPRDARLLMPLYQPVGSDGFFLARRISTRWLAVSSVLRRLGADRLVHLAPGVRRENGCVDRLLVNRRVARWFAEDVMHLLGYRRVRDAGAALSVSRRPFGLAGPARVSLV